MICQMALQKKYKHVLLNISDCVVFGELGHVHQILFIPDLLRSVIYHDMQEINYHHAFKAGYFYINMLMMLICGTIRILMKRK